MPAYAFYPFAEHQKRADRLNFCVASGPTEMAARIEAETLLGEIDALVDWVCVELTSAPAVFVNGMPVGSRHGTKWPTMDAGGSYLLGV